MKKILTAMTAMTMTLQSSESIGQEINTDVKQADFDLETLKSNLNSQIGSNNYTNYLAKSNNETLAGSGSLVLFNKSVRLGLDADNSGNINEGDVLIYEISSEILESVNASGLFLQDILDDSTSLVSGSVTTTDGIVVTGNNPNDTFVEVDIGDLDEFDSANVSFAAIIDYVPDGQIIDIVNQALLMTDNHGTFLSDDPSIFNEPADPTVINAFGSINDLYDEFSEDDFAEYHATPTQITLRSEIDRISGTVGGPGLDLEDCFQFNVEPFRVVKSIILEDYNSAGNNQSTAFHVYYDLPPIKFSAGNLYSGSINENRIGNDLIGNIVLLPGIYSVCLIEATPGQDYSLVFLSEIENLIFNNGFESNP